MSDVDDDAGAASIHIELLDDRPADPDAAIGRRLLDRYRLESRLAAGGMSRLYRGCDERLSRPVCVKIFDHGEHQGPTYRTTLDHFVQEAFALSRLSHPNTLRIYDFGFLDDGGAHIPFHVCELLDGGTLGQHVRRGGRLAPLAALAVLEPIIGALTEAHGQGIVHRDLKPSNIMFTSVGVQRLVKLVDFGIAKALGEGTPLAHRAEDTAAAAGPGLRFYSPGWAAPEQLLGGTIGTAVDVYSLGLLTAFLLTGLPVFSGESDVAIFRQRLIGSEHVAQTLIERGLTGPLADIVLRACAEAPGERYASVEEVGAALREATSPRNVAIRGDEVTDVTTPPPPTPGTRRPAGSMPPPQTGTGTGTAPIALDDLADPSRSGGLRVRLVPIHERLDIGGPDGAIASPARLRLSILPDTGRGAGLHIRGLNCFVARLGERPSSAVSLHEDQVLELISLDRQRMDVMRCCFGGAATEAGALFDLGGVALAVPAHLHPAIILDLGPGRELALLHRPAAPAVPQRGPR